MLTNLCLLVLRFSSFKIKRALRTSQLTTVDPDENSEPILHEIHRSLQNQSLSSLYRQFGECETSCQFDYNCQYEFFCAAEHTAELHHYGLDLHTAYCDNQNDIKKTNQSCFSPKKLKRGKIRECKGDCKKDSDCLYGLLCAKAHTVELKRWNYSPKYAYCKRRTNKFGEPIKHVCYDPTKTFSNHTKL